VCRRDEDADDRGGEQGQDQVLILDAEPGRATTSAARATRWTMATSTSSPTRDWRPGTNGTSGRAHFLGEGRLTPGPTVHYRVYRVEND
jgi:hypothetical protein